LLCPERQLLSEYRITGEIEVAEANQVPILVEGVDYYIENGRWVFTAEYHLKRGYCCGSGCRHCPYEERERRQTEEKK
jgi:Family of unknown function (DUF5522)